MLQALASKMVNHSYYGLIPTITRVRGGLELSALIAELGVWTMMKGNGDNEKFDKTFCLAACKVIQIGSCLGSMPFFVSHMYKRYLPAVIIGTVITYFAHTLEKDNHEPLAHNLFLGVPQFFLNASVKVINSLAIGQMVHREFGKGQQPGALMLGTSVIALFISSINVFKEWKSLAELRGD